MRSSDTTDSGLIDPPSSAPFAKEWRRMLLELGDRTRPRLDRPLPLDDESVGKGGGGTDGGGVGGGGLPNENRASDRA